jgi:C1q domain
MASKGFKSYFTLLLFLLAGSITFAQNVPLGIFYQAVARDNYGKELVNKDIDVKFSIISGNPLGTVVYQELHAHVITSKFGVFSLIIGHGTPTGGTFGELSQIQWGQAYHYLKVEVKFDNDFIDMGTMQFLAVPYALYAQKSLEPGPAGPKGDPGPKGDAGDPASDKQTLSFNGNNLSISGGNTVNLSILNVPHQLSLLGDTLSILGGNKVGLTNQIQDLQLDVNNKLKITKNPASTLIDLSKFNQSLSFSTTDNKLSISGGAPPVDLTFLKNDADADPTNELQTLNYNKNTGDLTISSKNTVNLENSVGFKAKKSISQTGLTAGSTYPFINPDVEFNDGAGYDSGTGSFTAPIGGIYTFCIYYKADGPGSSRLLSLLKNGTVYEILGSDILTNSELTKWVTIKLDQGNVISLTINTGVSTYSGTGSFIGYKVN